MAALAITPLHLGSEQHNPSPMPERSPYRILDMMADGSATIPRQISTPQLPLELVQLIIQHSARLPPSPPVPSSPSSSPPTVAKTHTLEHYYPPSYCRITSPPTNTANLCSAALVDRSWRDVAQPELYRHVQITQVNAGMALGALWRCVRDAQPSGGLRRNDGGEGKDAGSAGKGGGAAAEARAEAVGEDGAGCGRADNGKRMKIKTLELISLPDCADIHASPGIAELYSGSANPEDARASPIVYNHPQRAHGSSTPGVPSGDGLVPVPIDNLIIHDSALWTLALAYTFDKHHRATHPLTPAPALVTSVPSSLASTDTSTSAVTSTDAFASASTSWSTTPHWHQYLTLLAHLAPARITLHYPSSQRAMYLRRRSYIPICCGRPECRAALAKLWSAPVVPRDVVRDICDELWHDLVPVRSQAGKEVGGTEAKGKDGREQVVAGIVDEQPPMLSFYHHCADAAADHHHFIADDGEEIASDLDSVLRHTPGSYSITFAPCLCADAAYADDYCPTHVTAERRAMQVAAVLDGRLGLQGARRLAREQVARVIEAAALTAKQVEAGEANDGGVVEGEGSDSDMNMEAVDTAERPQTAGGDEQAIPGGEQEGEQREGDAADVLLQYEGRKLELRNVCQVGWTNKKPEEVRVAIWQEVLHMLGM